MSVNSAIEWTDATWNPVVGCTRVSAGCDNCYAVKMTRRLEGMAKAGPQPGKNRTQQYIGLTVKNRAGDWHFNGTVRTVPEALDLPFRWKEPRRVFVNSMSDLFHPSVPFEFIDRVFAVMALCPQHTFQVLTKRPKRVSQYLDSRSCGFSSRIGVCVRDLIGRSELSAGVDGRTETAVDFVDAHEGILPNVILGTSCEDQPSADKRIPHLLQCPAAVRMLSLEPLLGPIDFQNADGDGLRGGMRGAIHWVIVGGESGPNARPCNIDWIRSIIAQCKAAGVPCFVKQVGAQPIDADENGKFRRGILDIPNKRHYVIHDPKGGDMDEWPEDLRVREFPRTHEQGAERGE